MNALTGKIAGVSISPLATGPAGTSKIRIRGQTSFTGQNNPFRDHVFHGQYQNFGSNPGTWFRQLCDKGWLNYIGWMGGLLSINPDEWKVMTVLKGAAASALYGCAPTMA